MNLNLGFTKSMNLNVLIKHLMNLIFSNQTLAYCTLKVLIYKLVKETPNQIRTQLRYIIVQNLFISYYYFSVVAAGSKSSVHDLCIGVPQGSILGPLLFILFTKGLEGVVHAHNIQFYSYADDSLLLFNVHPHHQCSAQSQLLQIQNCLSDVNNWMSNHFLKLNVDKTEVMEVSIYPNL